MVPPPPSAVAADALDTLLRAGISPSDTRVRTLAALVHICAKQSVAAERFASAQNSSSGQVSPPTCFPTSGFTAVVLKDHELPFEKGQNALAMATSADVIAISTCSPFAGGDLTETAVDLVKSPTAFSVTRDLSNRSTADPLSDLSHGAAIFRLRAQVAGYRLFTRVEDPPAELLLASAGVSSPLVTNPLVSVASIAEEAPIDFHSLEKKRDALVASRVAFREKQLTCLKSVEGKALSVLGKQTVLRSEMADIMHRLLRLDNSLTLGGGICAFQRLTQERIYVNGYVPGDASVSSILGPDSVARVKFLEDQHRTAQAEVRLKERIRFSASCVAHGSLVRSSKLARQQRDKKMFKEIDRFFRDKVREEDRRKRKEQQDRLRALRNNDEDEYLELIRNTKNERLLQVLRQTDEYLAQLGAKVEAQKVAAMAEAEANSKFVGQEARSKSVDLHRRDDDGKVKSSVEGQAAVDENQGQDSVEAMHAGRNQYYTITHKIKEQVAQPSILVGGKLKPYQIDGLEWMVSLYNNGLNGILADEMGLGKTIQTLSLLTYLVETKKNLGPFLVIVPLSTVSNWVRELDAWAPSLQTIVYRGAPERRKQLQSEMNGKTSFQVVLTTYEFVVKDRLFLGKIKWKYIIIDEGHRMKNAECKLALTLGSKYKTRNRILLTGTPLQNNLTELWALLNFLLPTIFSSSDTFETWFNAPFQASSLSGNAELNEEEQLLVISRLHQVLRPFMLRRLKTDVETQLPDKVESVLRCDMSIWQKILYKQMTSNIGIVSSGSVRTFNNVVMQLKKVCNHPYLFYSDEELKSVPQDYIVRVAGKFEMLEHALTKLKATGHRVLLFSQMTAALDYLEFFLARMGIKHMRLDGTTKADDRQGMLERFNAPNSDYFMFLLSTRAGGLGLNLQTADTVFIFDSDWNPMMDLQAQDRAHRIGQTREVRVFRLITACSIEEKILERANRKLQMDAQIIQAGQFNNQSSDTDRTEMLKEILQSQARVGPDEDAVPKLEELNRLLARSDDEFDLFQEMDERRIAAEESEGKTRLLTDEGDLPSWVLKPEVSQKQKDREKNDEIEVDTFGRSRRKRTDVTYNDGLTDREWARAVETDGDAEQASQRKRQRVEGNRNVVDNGSN